MYEVGKWPQEEMAELFQEAAAKKGFDPIIVEKDFWVCWTLGHLFSDRDQSPRLIFKGGTSLSKVFRAIDRFSEDIDLSVNREDLGFTGERDILLAESSNKKKKRLVAELKNQVDIYLREDLEPRLRSIFTTSLSENTGWALDFEQDEATLANTLLFSYPQSLVDGFYPPGSYIQARVTMEFGGRSDHIPQGIYSIQSYAAEEFPALFAKPTCDVAALAAEKTFWEKAMSLHEQFHQPAERFKKEFSRHYYDVVLLSRRGIASSAMGQRDVFDSTRLNKDVFWHRGGSRYDLAVPGTFKLVPSVELLPLVEQGYADMREMFFPEPEPPSFGDIIEELGSLENEINSLDWA